MEFASKNLSALINTASSSGIVVSHHKKTNVLVFKSTTPASEIVLKNLAEHLINDKFYVEMFWRWNFKLQESRVFKVICHI